MGRGAHFRGCCTNRSRVKRVQANAGDFVTVGRETREEGLQRRRRRDELFHAVAVQWSNQRSARKIHVRIISERVCSANPSRKCKWNNCHSSTINDHHSPIGFSPYNKHRDQSPHEHPHNRIPILSLLDARIEIDLTSRSHRQIIFCSLRVSVRVYFQSLYILPNTILVLLLSVSLRSTTLQLCKSVFEKRRPDVCLTG